MKYKNKEIRAIHEKDLDSFLEKLELLEPLKRGELYCSICGKKLTKNNLGLVYTENKELKICCNKSECYFKTQIGLERG
jgi:hypothetical protein